MAEACTRLLAVGSTNEEGGFAGRLSPQLWSLGQEMTRSLEDLLRFCNGFSAFEGALQVFGSKTDLQPELERWNALDGWRLEYAGLASHGLFFAQDVFGGQFCISDLGVEAFDPETGSYEMLARDLDQWCELVLADYEVLTGYPLAHAWQLENGPLPAGARLVPKVPFSLGGQFDIPNLYALEVGQSMLLRASWARQLCSVPDGSAVFLDTGG
jgi:hypothetical protein